MSYLLDYLIIWIHVHQIMIIMLVKVQYFVKEREDTVPAILKSIKGCLHASKQLQTELVQNITSKIFLSTRILILFSICIASKLQNSEFPCK